MTTIGLTGVALITGAASGIGKETALSFAEAGASAIIFAFHSNEKGAEEALVKSKTLATHPNYRAITLSVDVSVPSSVQAMVDATVKEFGRIDYYVHSAGVVTESPLPISEASVEEFDKLASINTKGTMLCLRAVSKAMSLQEPLTFRGRNGSRDLGKGSIVTVGSAVSLVVLPGMLNYASSKHALMGISKTAALDNTPHGIRVNAVCPSWVDTPMMDRLFEKLPPLRDMIKQIAPGGRMAVVDEVAEVIMFLCSPAASYINGVGLLIDGGLTLSSRVG